MSYFIPKKIKISLPSRVSIFQKKAIKKNHSELLFLIQLFIYDSLAIKAEITIGCSLFSNFEMKKVKKSVTSCNFMFSKVIDSF